MELAPFNVDVVNATVGSFSSSLVDNAGTSQLKARCAADLRFRICQCSCIPHLSISDLRASKLDSDSFWLPVSMSGCSAGMTVAARCISASQTRSSSAPAHLR